MCGNGVCEPEDAGPEKCPQDCGLACGDCKCNKGESFSSCPVDCGFCGDGVCSLCSGLGEGMATCPADCKASGCGLTCEDGIACTLDLCASDGGCAHLPDSAACSDDSLCTLDSCTPTGCAHTNSLANCDDGNACTVNDQCLAGKCQSGAAKDCNDGNPCTLENCAPSKGCETAPASPGSICGGGLCTASGNCATPPAGMVLVPGGTFWMGCNPTKDKNCAADEQAQHPVTLKPYFIGSSEVTTSAWLACIEGGGCTAPDASCSGTASNPKNWDNAANLPAAGRAQHPVNCVNWAQARSYCQWLGAGFDLATEAQWELAARGSCEKNKSKAGDPSCAAAMRTYPWGEQAPSCDFAIVKAVTGLECQMMTTAPVATKPAGTSPYGVFDMTGNVSEWVRDGYASSYPASQQTEPFNATATATRVVRGSSYADAAIWPANRISARQSRDPAKATTSIGFRCVAPVE